MSSVITMTSAEIRKGKGIEDLLKGYGTQAEVEREIKTEGENDFQELMRKYELVLQEGIKHDCRNKFVHGHSITDVLTPDQINAFLQATVMYEEWERYQLETGFFISKLMQNSYNAGHNGFHLNNVLIKELDYLCAFVSGTEERPIEVTITGKTGDFCGSCAWDSIFRLEGDTGHECGRKAEHSLFIISKAGDGCAYNAANCTFRTPDRETLKQLVYWAGSLNRIEFLHADGTIEHVTHYELR